MSMKKFSGFQHFSRALFTPIAVLPLAGLLLRFGQPDLLGWPMVAQAGAAIFSHLALIFAIGVAVGLAKDHHGVAGLAGAVGFLILNAVLTAHNGKLNMGVLSGMISGVVAGALYNRFKDIELPPCLAFFSGKRFVPIITGVCCLLLGVLFGSIWPPIQGAIDAAGHWISGAGSLGLFMFGFLARLLIVTGLHHILDTMAWFVIGSFTDASGKVFTGDLNRFFAGDPSAGGFMTGLFPVMMFGLPAACLAMYRCARSENRSAVGGVLLSMALTPLLTGISEPVEFSFMFLAPLLYLVHAILTGLAMVLTDLLHIRLGMYGGLVDFLLSSRLGENPLLLLPVGLGYFALYYFIFSFAIRKFDLKTLGREEAEVRPQAVTSGSARARDYITALGGAGNLQSVYACATRLRLRLGDSSVLDEAGLKRLGAHGIIRLSADNVQVVVGGHAEMLADEILQVLARAGAEVRPANAGT